MKNIKLLVITICMVASIQSIAKAMQSNDLQNVLNRDRIILDGVWDVIVDPLENGYYNHRWNPREDGYFQNDKMEKPSDLIEYDFDSDLQLNVPGDWNTQEEKLYYYEGTIWYKREFDYKPKTMGENLFLYFGAVNYDAIVYLNGKKLGQHIGGFTPFQFDVTGKVKSEKNWIVVKVDNKRKREAIPTINTDWWNYGGITRSVYLIQTPKEFIRDYTIKLSKESDKKIDIKVELNDASLTGNVEVNIPELKISKKISVTNGKGSLTLSAKPKLWSPSNPKLYEVTFSYNFDTIKDQIGFRRVETKGTKILLNGKEIFLKGISIHEESPFKTGRVTTLEECRTLLNWALEMGCNFVRLAHYPHNEFMVREAEKLGLIVWSEIPVYWTVLFDNEGTYQNAENQLVEMIHRDKNRANIVMWSIANETPEGDARLQFLKKLSEKVRSLDKTRLVTAALDTHSKKDGLSFIEDDLGKYVDVIGINSYCGWYSKAPNECMDIKWGSDYDKPVIVSEFGAGALQGLHGTEFERWTEEYQAAVYRNNIAMLKNMSFLAGTSPWILMDFRSHRRHLRRIQRDFNRKGLISEQGVKKQAFFILQEYYNSIDNK